MPKIFKIPKFAKFSTFSLRDFVATAGPATLAVILIGVVSYWLIDPTPPKQVVLSTGQENSAYDLLGQRYAKSLARRDIKVVLKPSLGSQENLQRLGQLESDVDIAFVQSGSTRQSEAERMGLISLGSLFTEPVWLFYREKRPLPDLRHLAGWKVNVGPEGSGVPALFKKLLAANGLEPADLTLGSLENTPATVALLDGRIDALVFSSAPDALLIQMLLQTPGIKLFDFTQAEAYSRRFPFLTHVVLPKGIVDLGRNLPDKDYHLIAPTATLVARADLHPALLELFVHSAARIHGGTGWFQKRGEFPTSSYTEIPVANAAERYYKNGPSFLQRYLPFWLGNLFERMWVVIVALGALLIPLSRVLPPLYVWKVRSRIYRWYGQLRAVEYAVEAVPPEERAKVYPEQLRRLNDIEEKVNQISIPLSFAEELYGLRSHINFVRKRIAGLMQA